MPTLLDARSLGGKATTGPNPHRDLSTADPAAHFKKGKVREFQVRDLILKRRIQTTRQKDQVKFGHNWKGPYIIIARGGIVHYN